ncbi:GNAT family N-acetyltransferase [Gorillibacterium timonense]|uniref:GNAT family N-acetyltransferase n=1 Tax=Gorillibacterium timonense TaxID=1689269 RepID=UPI00071D0986|nr:GNAT family N-acetyltransferase [Gorillibacterium timonense]
MTHEVEILEVKKLDTILEKSLSELLIDVVGDGASIGFLPPLAREEAAAYWKGVLQKGVRLWIAKKNNRVIGTVQLHLALKENGRHRAEVAKLMVHPIGRGEGTGRKLMQTIEKAALEEERSLLVLDTRAGDPSNALYRSLGYLEAGRIPHYARSANGMLHDTIFYYKELN